MYPRGHEVQKFSFVCSQSPSLTLFVFSSASIDLFLFLFGTFLYRLLFVNCNLLKFSTMSMCSESKLSLSCGKVSQVDESPGRWVQHIRLITSLCSSEHRSTATGQLKIVKKTRRCFSSADKSGFLFYVQMHNVQVDGGRSINTHCHIMTITYQNIYYNIKVKDQP